ncbi:MAG: hypothetical protein FWH14_00965 [Oscillospiraceae bacterium]|nr:hypothetical protein [Oscillospiraceae bacterium]
MTIFATTKDTKDTKGAVRTGVRTLQEPKISSPKPSFVKRVPPQRRVFFLFRRLQMKE